jgi:hypothetical protein
MSCEILIGELEVSVLLAGWLLWAKVQRGSHGYLF